MGPEFFQTMMGRKFYEGDVPRIAKGIERLVEAIEKQNELTESGLPVRAPDSLKTLTGPFMAKAGGAALQHDVGQTVTLPKRPEDAPFYDPLIAAQDAELKLDEEAIDAELLSWLQNDTKLLTDGKAHRNLVTAVTGLVRDAAMGGLTLPKTVKTAGTEDRDALTVGVDVDQEISQAGIPLTEAEVGNGVGDILQMLKNAGTKGVLEITDAGTRQFLYRESVRLELAKSHVLVKPEGGKTIVWRE